MAFNLGSFQQQENQGCLSYDADEVRLAGEFSDELSVYRARREWINILANYFLLKREHDFDIHIEIDQDTETPKFIAKCTFTSACGRYAFWRLINHQAPEAERLLRGTESQCERSNDKLFDALWGTNDKEDLWKHEEENDQKGWCPDFLTSAFSKINKLL